MAKRDRHRANLVDQVADFLLVHGLADPSLKAIAEAVGTSDRMLLYYFVSKEEMLTDALVVARARNRDAVRGWADANTDRRTPAELLTELWQLLSSPALAPNLSLYFDAYGQALRQPTLFSPFLEGTVTDWVGVVAEVLRRDPAVPSDRVDGLATLVVGAVRGLLLDLLTTGDIDRVEAGAAELVASIEAIGAGPQPRRVDSSRSQVVADDLAARRRAKRRLTAR